MAIMKKTFLILLVALMLCMTSCVSETSLLKLTASTQTVTVGDTLTFTVSIPEGSVSATSYAVRVSYDTTKFELTEATMSYSDSSLVSGFENGVGAVAFEVPHTVKGEMMVFTLKALEKGLDIAVNCEVSIDDGIEMQTFELSTLIRIKT